MHGYKRDKDTIENILKKCQVSERKILIAGGTGFIGFHLAKKLKKITILLFYLHKS